MEKHPRKTDLAVLCKYPYVLQSHSQIDAVGWKERQHKPEIRSPGNIRRITTIARKRDG
ncbi:hypothetical protein RTE01_02870 [Raoultella terrigena]|nr:hypothetical protein RTE01_02870 [Raoultella terrigena]